MIDRFTLNEVLELHDRLIVKFGGLGGLRDKGLLEASLSQPYAIYAGIEFYPSIEEKAARFCYEIVRQHPFVDGNKRTGLALMVTFLKRHGLQFKPRHTALITMISSVAAGDTSYDDLVQFVRDNSIECLY